MLPLIDVPSQITQYMAKFRACFQRQEGFDHVCRYIAGLILSENKTLEGIHDAFYFDQEKKVSRRAMHQSVFETDWKDKELIRSHWEILQDKYAGGKSSIVLDTTMGHHERGLKIFGVKKGYDYVNGRYGAFQNVWTISITDGEKVDGIDLWVQPQFDLEKEKIYLEETSNQFYETKEEASVRLLELLSYEKHQKEYKPVHELFIDKINEIEKSGFFSGMGYVFDNGILHRGITETIESYDKNWLSEIEKSRGLFWVNRWLRAEDIDELLRKESPRSFKKYEVKKRGKKEVCYWVFTKVLRLKKGWGKKRIAIVHEREDLTDAPRFLITNAKNWSGGKMVQEWSYRWPCEVFHEFIKEQAGLEKAQVRNEKAVRKHLYLSCISQSIIQILPGSGSTSEKFAFSKGKVTIGQKVRTLTKESIRSFIQFIHKCVSESMPCDLILEKLMPA